METIGKVSGLILLRTLIFFFDTSSAWHGQQNRGTHIHRHDTPPVDTGASKQQTVQPPGNRDPSSLEARFPKAQH